MGEMVRAALERAWVMFDAHPDWDLMRALAEATTCEQCGTASYLVFADVRKAISQVLPQGIDLPTFCKSASAKEVRAAFRAVLS